MESIKIYKAEASDGLGDTIQSNNSIAYSSVVEVGNKTNIKTILSSVTDKKYNIETLYAVKSLLVSTNWNKNDDVFSPQDTWAARHTPINTQTNIEHNQGQIVGHITSVWVVDNNGKLIKDDVTEAPDYFHVCDGSVIYKYWQNAELQKKVDNLIEKINAGEMHVSMECLFSNFDYAIISPEDEYYTIARNEDTAFLTKHLRSYGGSGIFEDYRVGRLLRGQVFSGKGYVEVPANPNSIIFDDPSSLTNFSFSSAKRENPFDTHVGVVVAGTKNKNDMENDMSDMYKEQLDEVKAAVASLTSENDNLKQQLSEANVSVLNETITKLEADNQVLTEAGDKLNSDIKQNTAKINELEGEAAVLNSAKEEAETELTKVKAEKLFANRVSILVEGGLSKEDAETKVSKFEYLNDEQFEEISATILVNKSDTETTEEVIEEETDVASASEEVLEDAEPTDVEDAMGAANDDDTGQQESVRTAMAKLFGAEVK